MSAKLGDFFWQADAVEEGDDLGAYANDRCWLFGKGVAEDVVRFFFHASIVTETQRVEGLNQAHARAVPSLEMSSPTQIEWNLHLSRWVIEDGEGELHVGDVFDWAISFWSDTELVSAMERTKAAVPLAHSYYRVNAEIIYISHDPKQAACILDFGIRAVSDFQLMMGVPLPPGCQAGDYVTGEVRLNLPLCTAVTPHDLDLNDRWRVNRVSTDLADFSQPDDLVDVRYQDISGTDSVQAGSYVLHCSHLNP